MNHQTSNKPSYTAIINFDVGGSGDGGKAQARTHLYAALQHLGWEKAKTTALLIETTDLDAIWKGMLSFVKAQSVLGTLTAVSFTVQRTDEPGSSTPPPSEKAYADIQAMPFPWGSKEQ